jgi:hypothetical protein
VPGQARTNVGQEAVENRMRTVSSSAV